MRTRLADLLIAVAVSACCGGDVGCASLLSVEFDRTPTGYVRVEAFTDTLGARYVVECRHASDCPTGVALWDYTPDWVIIRVITDTNLSDTQFRPAYHSVHPNGRYCSPECRQAFVRVRLPA